VFVDETSVDVVRALYGDLTGQTVRRGRQFDGRVFIVEPYDFGTSVNYFWRGELSAYAWLRSFKGGKSSPGSAGMTLMAWARLAIEGVGKLIQTARFKSHTARQLAGADRECRSNNELAVPQHGLWSRLISPMWRSMLRSRCD
jgi:hypothetical protein